jgi:subfamily B ATP-binding cassette protein MsbA
VLLRPRRRLLLGGLALIFLSRTAGLALPASTKFLIDDVIVGGRSEWLVPLVAGVALATLVQGVCSFGLMHLLSSAAHRLIADLRVELQAHVGRLAVAWFDARKAGTLANRVMHDVDGLRNLIGTGLVEFVGGLVSALLALGLMLWISPRMTGLTLAALAAFGLLLQQAMAKLRPIFRERSRIQSEVGGRLTESLSGIRVVKAYRAEARESAVFAHGVRRLLDSVLVTLNTASVLSLASSVLLGAIGASVMYLGARSILTGELSVGGFFTYTVLLGFLVGPVFQVVGVGTQLTEALAGLERVRELLSEPTEDADPGRTREIAAPRGEVVFEHVDFAYEAGQPVLRDVSFHAEPGSVTALVGPSGAGKSTLIGLIAAFAAPSAGRILADGVDLAELRLGSWRAHLGVVFQDTFLFDGTIRENVAFSRPDAPAGAVEEACRLAGVADFADGFERGYETLVGERGVKLSGGQRQRVAIARAILAEPRLLLLDEATSSLDSESEARIQEGLAWLMQGRTSFVIAHRLSTIRRADCILVLDEGRIVERGTHQELLAKGGRYHAMYTRQHDLAANLFLAPGEEAKAEETAAAPAAEPGSPLSGIDLLSET